MVIAEGGGSEQPFPTRPIRVPSDGLIRTAFAIGPGVNVIDTAGPWDYSSRSDATTAPRA
jgi:hypothetical protein